MRIKENFHDGHEAYSYALQEQVEEVFQYASLIVEIKRLLGEIRKEAVDLRTLFLTEEELEERRAILSAFDTGMKEAVFITLKNLESYQQYCWREIIFEGESSDGGIEPV